MASPTERKVELDGTLWFVTCCGGCPLRKDRKKSLPICTRLNRVIADVDGMMSECPLEAR